MSDDPNGNNGSPLPGQPAVLNSPPPRDGIGEDQVRQIIQETVGSKIDAMFSMVRDVSKRGREEPKPSDAPASPKAATEQPTNGRSEVEQLRLDWSFDKALTKVGVDDRTQSFLKRLYDAEKPADPASWLEMEMQNHPKPEPKPETPAPGRPAPAGADEPTSTRDSVLTWTQADVDRFVLENGGDPTDPTNIKNKPAYDKINTMVKSALKGVRIRLR